MNLKRPEDIKLYIQSLDKRITRLEGGPEQVLIKRNESDEYEVPTGRNEFGGVEIYYTDDLDDAYSTARRVHGFETTFTIEEGSYGE